MMIVTCDPLRQYYYLSNEQYIYKLIIRLNKNSKITCNENVWLSPPSSPGRQAMLREVSVTSSVLQLWGGPGLPVTVTSNTSAITYHDSHK